MPTRAGPRLVTADSSLAPAYNIVMNRFSLVPLTITMACSSGDPKVSGPRVETTPPISPSTTGSPGPGAFTGDYQTSATYFTRTTQPLDSGSVHGKVRIWYSANVKNLPTSGPFVVPVGTVAVKEEYDSAGRMFVKVVMIKKSPGYDPSNHDWYYEARKPDDTVADDPTPGKASLCIGCHRDAAATDYLQGFALAN